MTNSVPNPIQFDLKEILLDICHSLAKLEGKIDKVAEDVSDLKTNLARAEAELKGEIKVLEEKVDGITKRVDTQEFINRGVLVGLILAILGGFAKIFGLAK